MLSRDECCQHAHITAILSQIRPPIWRSQVWRVPKEKHQPGLVTHTFGWPLQRSINDSTFGGRSTGLPSAECYARCKPHVSSSTNPTAPSQVPFCTTWILISCLWASSLVWTIKTPISIRTRPSSSGNTTKVSQTRSPGKCLSLSLFFAFNLPLDRCLARQLLVHRGPSLTKHHPQMCRSTSRAGSDSHTARGV